MIGASRRKLIQRLGDRKGRSREGMVLVEGVRAAEEALAGTADVRFAVVGPALGRTPRGAVLPDLMREDGIEVVELPDAELLALTDTETPQGVLLVCSEPTSWSFAAAPRPPARVLLADAIQDPGNLGTLIRSARAFGLDGVVVLDGSVDPWNPKCIRSSAGAAFHVPLARVTWDELGPRLASAGIDLFSGVAEGEPISSLSVGESWILAVGNEGRGVRRRILDRSTTVSIPMAAGVESLNAAMAGTILMYAFTGSDR